MLRSITTFNDVDILYTLMTYVNVSSSQNMYYTIAQTILSQLDRMPDISINDLADLCYTSPATISRFCKDINCKSFQNFKQELQIALDIADEEIHLTDEDQERLTNNPQEIVNKIYDDTINSLMLGRKTIDMERVDHFCDLIYNAQKIHMYAYQFSKLVCTDFQLKMLKLKKFIYCFVDRGDEEQKLDTIEEGELVIIVSVRARKKVMDHLIEKISEKHPQIVLFTLNKNYKNDKISEYFHLDGFESDYTQSAMMGTINLMSLFNVIYLRYGLKYGNMKR